MDGLLDWYLVGVAAGLGVTAGAGALWALRGGSGRALGAAAAALALAVGVVIGVLAAFWAFVALAGAAGLALVSLRGLSAASLPAAVLGSAVVAAVPALGYLEGLAAPLLGRKLARRAGSRYAGLRILAKD